MLSNALLNFQENKFESLRVNHILYIQVKLCLVKFGFYVFMNQQQLSFYVASNVLPRAGKRKR